MVCVYMDGLFINIMFVPIIYYSFLIINKTNAMLNNISTEINKYVVGNMDIISKFIDYHQFICIQIKYINKCSAVIYYSLIIIIYPTSLLFLHQLLFERLSLFVKIFYILTLILFYIPLFGVQYLLALYSKRLHQMCVKLSRLQWRINGWPFRMRFKLKLLICFEKLSSSLKLGVSIGSLGVITLPVFSRV